MDRKREAQKVATCTRSSANAKVQISADDDALLALEQQFEVLAREFSILLETSGAKNGGVEATHGCEAGWTERTSEPTSSDMTDRLATERLGRLEAALARLAPIEQAIMATPAQTIVGLGVKARHAAYVLSEYWGEPLEKADWDRRAVRLLIEAVCHVAGRPLATGDPFG
jgi:hypothetical protein